MEMEELRKELEEMRSGMAKLSEEHRAKSALSESLRRAHDEQLTRLHEAKAEIEKQAREINAKAEEISLAKQMYEGLKSSFCQKESVLKQLSVANENLKTSYREKSTDWETRNKELISALDDASAKREEQERTICSYREEVDRLKDLLSLSQRKCSDAEERARAPKELSRRDEMLVELEQEKGRVAEQLKWKSEQFRHLEEAHRKTQDELWAATKQWGSERSALFDEINTLQMNLDSQTRVADDLRCQLQMCNQALAHEESRRKLLEIKISESKALYENVVIEYEEARSNIETLTSRRDEEVSTLRNSLAVKATLLKEAEFSRTHLELENQELKRSLKELQEAQINGVDSAASLKNLRQKFRGLEQAHSDCAEKLRSREVECTTLTEKIGKGLDECLAKLNSKDEQILELQSELEGSYSLLMQQKLENEEISIVCLVFESKFFESCSSFEKSELELELCSAKLKERVAIIEEQVEKNNRALAQSQAEIKRQHETVDSLQARLEVLESIEREYLLMQMELDSHREIFEESVGNLDRAREQASQAVNNLQEDLKKASDALDKANSALAEKTSEMHKVVFELQQLKTFVERMENLRSVLEIESNEKDKIIEDLQQQLVLFEKDFARRELEASTLDKFVVEKESMKFLQIAEDVGKKIEGAHTKLDFLQQRCEQTITEASINLERKEAMFQLLEQELVRSVEASTALKVTQKQYEVDSIYEALEKIMAAYIIDEHEIQYKSIVIDVMEQEIDTLQLKLVIEERRSFDLKDCVDRLKAETIMGRLERDKERTQAENVLKSMQGSKGTMEGRLAQLVSERGELVELMTGLDDLIGEVHHENEGLMRGWERVVKKAADEEEVLINLEGGDLFSYNKVEAGRCVSPPRNKAARSPDRRLPLKEHNCQLLEGLEGQKCIGGVIFY